MPSYGFIESGLIFAIKSHAELAHCSFRPEDFALHGDAFRFVTSHVDDFGAFPSDGLLMQKFPMLDATARGQSFEFCLREFCSQILFRKARDIIRARAKELEGSPVVTIQKLIRELGDIEIYSNGTYVYDAGTLERLELFRHRQREAHSLKIRGIPTPIRSLNHTRVGWLPGDLISIYARPTIGKTWWAIKVAAVAQKFGYRTLFLTPEMPDDQIALRMDVVLGRLYGYDFSHKALHRGEMIDEKMYEEFLLKVSSRSLFMYDHYDNSSLSFSGIQVLIRKHKPDIVVLDGIHLIGSEDDETWQRIYNLFYGMKRLCVTQKIVGVITTQAKRSAHNLFQSPQPQDVLFGDALIQASDIAFAMCLVRDQKYQRLLQLQKYRNGEQPFEYVILDWDVDRGIIREHMGEEENQVG